MPLQISVQTDAPSGAGVRCEVAVRFARSLFPLLVLCYVMSGMRPIHLLHYLPCGSADGQAFVSWEDCKHET